MIILLMFTHHFISTGCFISPLPFLCFDNFSWAIDVNKVKELSDYVQLWSKAGASPTFIIENQKQYLSNFNWFSNWYLKYFIIKFLDQIAILFVSIILTILIFKRFNVTNIGFNFKKKIFFIYFLLLIIFYVWFSQHPTLRYGGYSIFFLITAFPISLILIKLKDKENFQRRVKYFIIFILIIVNIKNFIRINNEIERTDIYKFNDFPFFAIHEKKYVKKKFENGLIIYKAHHCWDTPSPCGNFEDITVKKYKGYYFISRIKNN